MRDAKLVQPPNPPPPVRTSRNTRPDNLFRDQPKKPENQDHEYHKSKSMPARSSTSLLEDLRKPVKPRHHSDSSVSGAVETRPDNLFLDPLSTVVEDIGEVFAPTVTCGEARKKTSSKPPPTYKETQITRYQSTGQQSVRPQPDFTTDKHKQPPKPAPFSGKIPVLYKGTHDPMAREEGQRSMSVQEANKEACRLIKSVNKPAKVKKERVHSGTVLNTLYIIH